MSFVGIGCDESPPLEGEIRTGAADGDAVSSAADGLVESGMGFRKKVCLQLGKRGVDVRVPLLVAESIAVQVGRHDRLSEIGRLLDLEDHGVGSKGVQDATRDVDRVTSGNGIAVHDPIVILFEERLSQVIARIAGANPCQDRCARGGVEDMPGFRLAIRFTVNATRGFVIGVEVDREGMGGVEKLVENREVRAAPASTDDLMRELRHDVVKQATSEWA